MPNTLVHIGVQLPLFKRVARDVETPWILMGILLPDLPWILQRAIRPLQIFEAYDLRLYATAQASLFFCLLMGSVLSFFSPRPLKVFAVLAINSLAHLLLDASQYKWGIGVHLFAPISWSPMNYGFFWPENILSYLLSIGGLIFLFLTAKETLSRGLDLILPPPEKLILALTCILIYLFSPLLFINQVEKSNSAYVQTLRQKESRSGKQIELDRVAYSHDKKSVSLLNDEQVQIQGKIPRQSGTISVKGSFVNKRLINSTDVHVHNKYRDWASYLGLFLIVTLSLLTWVSSLQKKHKD